MGIRGRLRRWFSRAPRDASPIRWVEVYDDCAAAVRTFDRTLSQLSECAVRDRLLALGAQLPPLLAVADRLANAAVDDPAGALGERLLGLRAALRQMAADCEQVAARLTADPLADDLGDLLSSLGAGLADARRHGWTPIAPGVRDSPT